jgi:hypothetical protein
MKWFLPTATCTALVVVLALALPGRPSPARSEDSLHTRITDCRDHPDWFVPIHQYYDCNPRITPDFDFASLYSAVARGAAVPNPRDMRRSR